MQFKDLKPYLKRAKSLYQWQLTREISYLYLSLDDKVTNESLEHNRLVNILTKTKKKSKVIDCEKLPFTRFFLEVIYAAQLYNFIIIIYQ